LFYLTEANKVFDSPTSSLDLRHIVQNVVQWLRVSLLQYMYRITLQNVLLSNTAKYSVRHT